MNYIFNLMPIDVNAMQEQAAMALEARTEMLSREKYPKMWEKTDKNNAEKSNNKAKVPGRLVSKPMSWLCLIAGAFIFIPAMQDPINMVIPLAAGAVAMVVGLRGVRGEPSDNFAKSAKNLLRGKDKMPANKYSVVFSDAGMAVCDEGAEQNFVPFDQIERIVETTDAYFVFFGNRAMVLQKADLDGNPFDFSVEIANKTSFIRI